MTGTNHKMLVRIANREDLDQTASFFIWICAICLDLFADNWCPKF